ncbi:hypothetical protein J2S09_000227 [Bacillus fengqiuensis]|nr:hypothetical protein [Bacillus fengqiuensis]
MQHSKIPLTATEISNLWSTYISDSMAICVLKFFIAKVKDPDIKPILEQSLMISERHLQAISQIFVKEGYAVPQGFTDQDLNLQAAPLFFDTLYLHYIKQMGRVGINAYGLALSLSVRDDVVHFFDLALKECAELDQQVSKILLAKGIFIRSPYLNGLKEVEFVQDTHFLEGIINGKRPLLAVEVTHLYGNIRTASLTQAIAIGFSQAATSKDVTKFIMKCRDVMSKHMSTLGHKLRESHLKVPMTWNDAVTDSITSPFSEKLLMFHMNAILAVSLGDYGASLAGSMRKDLGMMYALLMTELATLAEEGAKIMIKHGWLETPPMVTDRDHLASVNKS